ncbi:MAG: dTDP-4-dehydrorhamnose 3,5-epimerase [Candidatus Eremiobacteraeota bacterium]|nr:dTDP-4-dehydrorhamnose 3,5-epimerase [Candidatus Eremiobacteraeota bacterium]
MDSTALPLEGARVITPAVFSDDRGFFKEVYSASRYRSIGIADDFVQDNVSESRAWTLRGLHSDPRMAKLVQVLEGEAYDVLVDIRRESPTYLRWCGVHLSAGSHRQVYLPPGFLHGFLALSERVIFSYKQSAEYDSASEIAVTWDDPDLAIDWPLAEAAPLLSPRDEKNPTLRELGYAIGPATKER